jgi:hypothetical protein
MDRDAETASGMAVSVNGSKKLHGAINYTECVFCEDFGAFVKPLDKMVDCFVERKRSPRNYGKLRFP